MRRSVPSISLYVLFIGMTGCGGRALQNSSPKSMPRISVAVSPSGATITTSQSRTFKATVLNDASGTGVTWLLSGSGCSGATCGTLANAGPTSVSYTAPTTIPNPDSVLLKAISIADSTKTATASVRIFPLGLADVTISPAAPSVQTGASIQLAATVAIDPTNAVTWSMSEPTTYCSLFPCGNLAPGPAGTATYTGPSILVGSGLTITIKATSVLDNTASDSVLMSITCAVPSDCIP